MQLHQWHPLAHGFMPLLLKMLCHLMPPMQALNVSKQRPLTAALVDGLELGPLLARGSFGSVFRGRFKGQKVAVKVGLVQDLYVSSCSGGREPKLGQQSRGSIVCINGRAAWVQGSCGCWETAMPMLLCLHTLVGPRGVPHVQWVSMD